MLVSKEESDLKKGMTLFVLAGLILLAMIGTFQLSVKASSGMHVSANCDESGGVIGTISGIPGPYPVTFDVYVTYHVPGSGDWLEVLGSRQAITANSSSVGYGPLDISQVWRFGANTIRVEQTLSPEKSDSLPPCGLTTPTPSPTATATPTITATPTQTATATPTSTPTPTPSPTPTVTATPTSTVTGTPTSTATPTVTPSPTVTPTPEDTLTPNPTVTPEVGTPWTMTPVPETPVAIKTPLPEVTTPPATPVAPPRTGSGGLTVNGSFDWEPIAVGVTTLLVLAMVIMTNYLLLNHPRDS